MAPPVTSGLVFHLEGGAGVTVSGSDVTGWADQSGQGNDLGPRGAPQLVSAGLNGRDYVAFDGTDDALFRAGFTGLPTGAGDRTAFIVVRYYDNPAGGWVGVAYGSPLTRQAFGMAISGQFFEHFGVQSWAVDYDTTVDATGAGWTIHTARLSSNTLIQRVAGTLEETDTGTAFNTGTSRIIIAQEISQNTNYTQMDLAEAIFYDRALSDAEILQVEGYLNGRYFESADALEASGALVTLGGSAELTISGTTLSLSASGALTSLSGTAGSSLNEALQASGVLLAKSGTVQAELTELLQASGALVDIQGTADLTVGDLIVGLAASGPLLSLGGTAGLSETQSLSASGVLLSLSGAAQTTVLAQLEATGRILGLGGTADLTTDGILSLEATGALIALGGSAQTVVTEGLAASGGLVTISGSAQTSLIEQLLASGQLVALSGTADLTAGQVVSLAATGQLIALNGTAGLDSLNVVGLEASGPLTQLAGSASPSELQALAASGQLVVLQGQAAVGALAALQATGQIFNLSGSANATFEGAVPVSLEPIVFVFLDEPISNKDGQ